VKREEKIASPRSGDGWTKPDAYIGALARKRSFRRAREDRRRTQPVSPHAWLSTVPFAAILAFLAVVVVGMVIIAFPGNQPRPKAKQAVVHHDGVAQRGWFQDAQKQFHK
jgi:hypothetical protein